MRQRIRHSIAVCTCNRLESFGDCVASIRATLTRPENTEVLIVDNGLVAHHGKLVAMCQTSFAGLVPFRVVHEPKPGIAQARNCALNAASGDIISYIDDDARVTVRSWQDAVLRVFKLHPEVAMLTGPVALVPPAGPNPWPWWRSTHTDALLSCGTQAGAGYCDPAATRGVAFHYRVCALRARGIRFDTRLGWIDGHPRPVVGEETDVNLRLAACGWRAWFDRDLAVTHMVASVRFRPGWLLRRSVVQGRTDALIQQRQGLASRVRLIGRGARYVLRHGAGLLAHAVQLQARTAFGSATMIAYGFGVVDGALHLLAGDAKRAAAIADTQVGPCDGRGVTAGSRVLTDVSEPASEGERSR